MKMIGSLDCESDELPRIRICAPCPVRPPPSTTTKPGSRAVSRLETSLIGALAGGVMTATELPSRFVSVFWPEPVTTTWLS